MTLPADEAASALKDAEAAAGRATAAHGYKMASGYLIVWGVVWAVTNVACQISLHLGQLTWMVGAIVGVAVSVALGSRQGKARGKGGPMKALIIATAIGGFGAGVSAVAPPLSFAQSDAMACLAVGAVYMAMGAAAAPRLSAVGAVVLVATVAGWFLVRDQFFLWMAVVGGGSLILGGLWFRKV